MKKYYAFLLILVYRCLFPDDSTGQPLNKKINNLLSQAVLSNDPGASVLVARGDTILYRKAFGKANLELGLNIQPDHIFRIGSLTKQFTACAILQLAEQKKLSLNDRITKYIPGFPEHGITIEHLLTHTSGLNTGTGQWTPELRKKDLTPKELIDLFKDKSLDFAPGTAFRYNNNGYVLLGYIIERISHTTYAQFMTTHFFEPLGMKSTFIDNSSTIIHRRINGYRKEDDTYKNAGFLSMTQPYAAGNILSTTGDLFTWIKALISYRVIKKESLEKMMTSYKLSNSAQTGYGFGWWISNIQGSPAIKHDGLINGFTTFCTYLPKEKMFVTVLTNCENNNPEIIASYIASIVIGKPYHGEDIHLSADQLKSYASVYASDKYGQRILAFAGNHLLYYTRGGLREKAIPFEKDKFYFKSNLDVLSFLRDEKGGIDVMQVCTNDEKYTFRKTDSIVVIPAAINISFKDLEKYTGPYRFSNNAVLYIIREDGKLYGKGSGPGQTRQEILPYDKNSFFAVTLDAELIFHEDGNGKITGLTKLQNGEQTAVRIEDNP